MRRPGRQELAHAAPAAPQELVKETGPFYLRKSYLDNLAPLNPPSTGTGSSSPKPVKPEGQSYQHPLWHGCSEPTWATKGLSGQAETSGIGMQHSRL